MAPTRPAMRHERDMNKNQKGLVDTCFEEGQYEAGISVLDAQRLPHCKPSTPHIRQLLYISLYPPPPYPLPIKGKGRASSESPSKTSFAKQQRSSLQPSPVATEAAQRLLFGFSLTNDPSSLFSALPGYPLNGEGKERDKGLSQDIGDEDSYIAKQALCISECKDCWSIVREGAVQRKEESILMTRTNARKRKTHESDEEIQDDESSERRTVSSVVGCFSWPILEWFVGLFEKDAALSSDSSKFSKVLLSQIPPSRTAGRARWDTAAILDIVFFCLQQTIHNRITLGYRLLALLANLTATLDFDSTILIQTLSVRISSLSSEQLTELFSNLPSNPSILKFKVMLCANLLADNSKSDDNSHTPQGPRPRPQARGQLQPVLASTDNAPSRLGGDVSSGEKQELRGHTSSSTQPVSLMSLPSAKDLIVLVTRPISSTPVVLSRVKVKYELLISYGEFQCCAPPHCRDADWQTMVRDGRLTGSIKFAFCDEEDGDEDIRTRMVDFFNVMIHEWKKCLA